MIQLDITDPWIYEQEISFWKNSVFLFDDIDALDGNVQKVVATLHKSILTIGTGPEAVGLEFVFWIGTPIKKMWFTRFLISARVLVQQANGSHPKIRICSRTTTNHWM